MENKFLGLRHIITGGTIVLVTGLGTAGITSAATASTSNSAITTSVSARTPVPSGTPPSNPATLTHGPGETLLTGSDLSSAVAAAEAAVPDATVVRAETDSAGSPYEVHMLKADGTYVTVTLNDSFVVTSIEKGFGPGPAGVAPMGTPRTGTPPAGAPRGTGPVGPPPSTVAGSAA